MTLSDKKKEHTLKLFGPDIFRWGEGLPRERVGAKKFSVPLETQCKQTVDPEVLQSGFGVIFNILAWRNLGKLQANFSANFDGDFFRNFFGLVFQGFRTPPPQKRITPKIHSQTCRHSSPISLSRTQHFCTPIFCFLGRPKNVWRISLNFGWDIPGVPEKFEKTKVCVQELALDERKRAFKKQTRSCRNARFANGGVSQKMSEAC